jgi:hypothetical protein
MGKRKQGRRTVAELQILFNLLPDARLCFDIGQARQVDPTITEVALLFQNFFSSYDLTEQVR